LQQTFFSAQELVKVSKSLVVEDMQAANKSDAIPSQTFMKTQVTEISEL
jgi:hypothetical protein